MKSRSHGMSRTPIYGIWQAMRQRCENPSAKDYKHYGGRGIAVCREWRDFSVFFADMGHPPAGKWLDRRDNNGDYCKSNCRWATPKEQALNTRASVFFDVDGKRRPIREIEIGLGLSQGAIWQRINKKGWSVEKAITTPRMAPRASARSSLSPTN